MKTAALALAATACLVAACIYGVHQALSGLDHITIGGAR